MFFNSQRHTDKLCEEQVMNSFIENNCRMCRKVFCCKNCREKHETTVHKLFLDCHICLYGKAFIKDPGDFLTEHIKSQHWPLHCINCKQIFGSFEDITRKANCVIEHKNQKSPFTPIQSSEKFESPPYFPMGQLAVTNKEMFLNLATSTPLQREDNLRENTNPGVITPVEYSETNKDKKFGDNTSLKRKVTFCETPMIESNKNKAEDKFKSQEVTPSSGNSAIYYSTTESLSKPSTPPQIAEKPIGTPLDILPIIKIEGTKEIENSEHNSTLWISAINTSPVDSKAENKPLDVNTTTPVITKPKKRQVNVVLPTTFVTEQVEVELESNLHSTALNITNENDARADESKLEDNVISDISNTSDANKALPESSIMAPARFWTSVSKLVKNVTNAVQELSNVTYHSKTPLKRRSSEYDPLNGPRIKRFKLTEIKCRRPIREFTLLEHPEYSNYAESVGSSITVEIKKVFVDKATQTE